MAAEADLEQVARVNVDVWRETYQGLFSDEFLSGLSYDKATARFARMVANPEQPSFLMVAEADEGIVGYAHAGVSRERTLAPAVDGELYGLYLMPAYHGKGIGKALVSAATEELKRRGFGTAVVVVFTDNAHARAVYSRLGARPLVERQVKIGGEPLAEWLYVWDSLPSLEANGFNTTDSGGGRAVPSAETDGVEAKAVDAADAAKKQLVKAQFSRSATAYVKSASHGNQAALDKVLSALQPDPDWIVLDVATGGGHVARALADRVEHVVASDLTPEMLSAARKYIRDDCGLHNVSFVIGDAEALPFLHETFDAVTCRIAPHHFVNPRSFVAETARVLKPGGRFLLVDNIVPEDAELADWYNTLERLRDPSHVRCAPASEWKSWMQECGLTLFSEESSWKTFEFETWARRMVTSQEQYETVVSWLVNAPSAARDFFNVQVQDGTVTSFRGIEWMVLTGMQKGI